jgi:hypothetical protein
MNEKKKFNCINIEEGANDKKKKKLEQSIKHSKATIAETYSKTTMHLVYRL